MIRIFNAQSLPKRLRKNSLYIVSSPNDPYEVKIYYIGNTPNEIKKILDTKEQNNENSSQSATTIKIVSSIQERNNLNPTGPMFVFVTDASDDPTVGTGSALYIYDPNNSSWIKVFDHEDSNLDLSWETTEW